MTYPPLFFCIAFFTPAFMLGMGLIFLFKKDWAWAWTEWMVRHVRPQRTPEWERDTTVKGWILVVGAVLTTVFILSKMY